MVLGPRTCCTWGLHSLARFAREVPHATQSPWRPWTWLNENNEKFFSWTKWIKLKSLLLITKAWDWTSFLLFVSCERLFRSVWNRGRKSFILVPARIFQKCALPDPGWIPVFTWRHSTGSARSKYEHRRTSALLRYIRNIRICTAKKPIVSVTYENERISIKKQLTLLKMCVTSLLCSPRADLWSFYGLLCKRFSLYV